MNRTNSLLHENEYLNFKSLFFIFNKDNRLRTGIILFIALLFGIFYAYFSIPVYKTYVSLEVDVTKGLNTTAKLGDLLSSLKEPVVSDIETEMDVLRSKFLVEKAVSAIDMEIRYFQKDFLKTTEFYHDAPFRLKEAKVFNPEIYAEQFEVKRIDERSFFLSFQSSWLDKVKNFIFQKKNIFEKYVGVYAFGQTIENKDFSFTIDKVMDINGDTYYFQFTNKAFLIEEIRKKLTIKPASSRSSVIKVEYEDVIPMRLKAFLNALASEYIKQNIHKKTEDASITLSFINQQLENVKTKLENSAEDLKNFKEHNDFISIDSKSRELVDKLIEYDKALEDSKLQLSAFSALKKELNSGNYAAVSTLSDRYPVLADLVTELETTRSNKEALLVDFTQLHPKVIEVTQKIEDLERSITNITIGVEKLLLKNRNDLQQVVQKQSQKLNKLPAKEQELATFERVYSVNEKLYSYLLGQQSSLNLAAASKVSDSRILDEAIIKAKPYKPNFSLILATSLFLGLVLSIFLALFTFDNKIRSREDLLKETDIPLLGSLPFVKNRALYNQVYTLEDPKSAASEAIRTIITNLKYIPVEKKGRVIVITSTVPNEGKTTTTANLAAVLGMGESKSILLSLDLRRPEIHKKFGLSNKVGMSTYLSKQIDLTDIIWEHQDFKNLNIITSGHIPPNPYELIDSKTMENLIETLRKEYDYIIIDTPPVYLVPDAMALMQYADISLFVVKSEFSEQSYIKYINEIVKKYHVKNAGLILNSLKDKYISKKHFDYRYIYFNEEH